MKQYINYVVLSLLSTVALFSACDVEDPEIPTAINYRYVSSEKEITNIPDEITSGHNIRERFFFGINNSLYFSGNCYETPDGNIPYYNTALYQYDTNTGKWKIAWYISEEEIRKLEETEDPTDEKWEKIEQLKRMVDIVRDNNFNQGNICTYNGKGYIFADGMTMEFTPTTNEFTFLNYNSSYYSSIRRVFSTTKGIFGINDNGSSELYQYSPQTNWKKVGLIFNELLNYVNNNSLQLFSQQENLYTWEHYGDYQFSVQRYSYPYTSMDKYNLITYPHDYGWTDDDYYYSTNYIDPYYDKLFSISGKIYKLCITNQSTGFYEFDPKSQNLSLVFLKKYSYIYNYDSFPLAVMGNKLYYTTNNQSILEITF